MNFDKPRALSCGCEMPDFHEEEKEYREKLAKKLYKEVKVAIGDRALNNEITKHIVKKTILQTLENEMNKFEGFEKYHLCFTLEKPNEI